MDTCFDLQRKHKINRPHSPHSQTQGRTSRSQSKSRSRSTERRCARGIVRSDAGRRFFFFFLCHICPQQGTSHAQSVVIKLVLVQSDNSRGTPQQENSEEVLTESKYEGRDISITKKITGSMFVQFFSLVRYAPCPLSGSREWERGFRGFVFPGTPEKDIIISVRFGIDIGCFCWMRQHASRGRRRQLWGQFSKKYIYFLHRRCTRLFDS